MITFIIILSVILIGIAIYAICRYVHDSTNKKYREFVLQNSVCLKRINEINGRYEFFPQIDFDQYHTYDNEKIYDTISCEDYLIYQLQFIEKKVKDQINKININKQRYSQYQDEIKSVMQYGSFSASIEKFKLDKLVEFEKDIIAHHARLFPCIRFEICVTLRRSSMSGNVYDDKDKYFSAGEVLTLIKRLNNKRGTFYNDRGIWDALCRVERGKVSNKLRFEIYERDGYRCRRCGVSGDNADLEIDHIIPIAKGGKSTRDNLQTLCHRCNVEKGDSW